MYKTMHCTCDKCASIMGTPAPEMTLHQACSSSALASHYSFLASPRGTLRAAAAQSWPLTTGTADGPVTYFLRGSTLSDLKEECLTTHVNLLARPLSQGCTCSQLQRRLEKMVLNEGRRVQLPWSGHREVSQFCLNVHRNLFHPSSWSQFCQVLSPTTVPQFPLFKCTPNQTSMMQPKGLQGTADNPSFVKDTGFWVRLSREGFGTGLAAVSSHLGSNPLPAQIRCDRTTSGSPEMCSIWGRRSVYLHPWVAWGPHALVLTLRFECPTQDIRDSDALPTLAPSPARGASVLSPINQGQSPFPSLMSQDFLLFLCSSIPFFYAFHITFKA